MLASPFSSDKHLYVQTTLETCLPRPAQLADVEQLAVFEKAVFPQGGTAEQFRLAREIMCYPDGHEILEINGQIAAHTHVLVRRNADGDCSGEITSIGVATEYRHRGLGRLMLGRALDRLMAEGPIEIRLYTRVSNAAMQQLAVKFGFHILRTRASYYSSTDSPEDGFLMVFRPELLARGGVDTAVDGFF